MKYLSNRGDADRAVGRANLIALGAAIERGDRDDAFHELGILLEHDGECAEYIALGRRSPARPGRQKEGIAA